MPRGRRSGPAQGRLRLGTAAWIVGIGLLALGLRAAGLTWGFPHSFNVDEAHVVYLASQLAARFQANGSLDPQASSYGALPLYLLALATALANTALHGLRSLLSLPFDSAPMLYIGRLISATASLATVALTAALARRLYGRRAAIAAGLLLAVSLLPVREAHFATVDSLLVALMMLALLLGESIARRGRSVDYLATGAALALAAATKVGAVLLLVPILVAHGFQVLKQSTDPRRPALTTHGGRLAGALLLAAALWFVLNPYSLLDPAAYFDLDRNDSLRTQGLVVQGDLLVLYTQQFANTTPYLYVFDNWLRWGLGLPLEVLSLLGAGYAGWRVLAAWRRIRRPDRQAGAAQGQAAGKDTNVAPGRVFADVYLLGWLLVYFLAAGGWYAKFIRYALPLVPVLCLLGGRLLADLWEGRLASRGRLPALLLAGAAVAAALAYTLAFVGIYTQPDVRLTAAAWIQQHVPAGASILVEKDEGLFLHKAEAEYGLTGYRWRIWDPYNVDGVASVRYQAPDVGDVRAAAYLNNLLDTDYVIIGSSWAERFRAAPAAFPAQADFYSRLFDGEAGYQLVQTLQVYPRLGPLVWHDDQAELTFRLFDHPAVYIFRREKEAQP